MNLRGAWRTALFGTDGGVLVEDRRQRAQIATCLSEGTFGTICLSPVKPHDESSRGNGAVQSLACTIPMRIIWPVLQTGHGLQTSSPIFASP